MMSFPRSLQSVRMNGIALAILAMPTGIYDKHSAMAELALDPSINVLMNTYVSPVGAVALALTVLSRMESGRVVAAGKTPAGRSTPPTFLFHVNPPAEPTEDCATPTETDPHTEMAKMKTALIGILEVLKRITVDLYGDKVALPGVPE